MSAAQSRVTHKIIRSVTVSHFSYLTFSSGCLKKKKISAVLEWSTKQDKHFNLVTDKPSTLKINTVKNESIISTGGCSSSPTVQMNSSIFKAEIKLCKHTPTCPSALTVNTHICTPAPSPPRAEKSACWEPEKLPWLPGHKLGRLKCRTRKSTCLRWANCYTSGRPQSLPAQECPWSQAYLATPTSVEASEHRALGSMRSGVGGGGGGGEGTAYVPYSGHCFANRASRPPLNN